ncbi:MAG TPA: PAS domain-containing protein [Stellaceae bacterium]|nr:PAS domain-containing protein [Stellaceae bacterium]
MAYDYRSDAVLGHVLAYWEERRGSRRMPARRDLDPTDLAAVLPHLQLIDVVPPDRLRYRLVGTALVDTFGHDYTGRFVDELLLGTSRAELITRVFTTVRDTARPVFLQARYFTAKNVDFMTNRIYLPLSENEAEVNMMLAALSFDFGTHRPPHGVWASAQLDADQSGLEVIEPA